VGGELLRLAGCVGGSLIVFICAFFVLLLAVL
jgi:hypothetical protein